MLSIIVADALAQHNAQLTDHIDTYVMPSYYQITPALIYANASISAFKRIIENIELHETMAKQYAKDYLKEFSKEDLQLKHQHLFKQECKTLVTKHVNLHFSKLSFLWINSGCEKRISTLSNDVFAFVTPIILFNESVEKMHYLTECCVSSVYSDPRQLDVSHHYIDLLYACKKERTITSIREKISDLKLDVQTVEYYKKTEGFHFTSAVTLLRALACVIESSNFNDVVVNLSAIKADSYTYIAACSFAELLYDIDIKHLEKITHYFGFYNDYLLKNILFLYQNKTFNTQHSQWYKDAYQNSLADPTSLFDPLEELSEEEYYSEYEKKIIEQNKPWWKKIFSKI